MPYIAIIRAFGILSALTFLTNTSPSANAANLISNGDFSQGNSGFTSGYQLSNDLTGETQYAVGSNPHLFHPGALNFGDHTTGTGQMLIANGAIFSGIIAWQETVSVVPHSTYQFSYWACSWGSDGSGNDQSPAILAILLNGQPLGTNLNVPVADAAYVNRTASWDSGTNTVATLEIVDVNTAAGGNDFILDDLAFIGPAVPEPTCLALAIFVTIATMTRGRRPILPE